MSNQPVYIVRTRGRSSAPPDFTVTDTLAEAREYADSTYVEEATIYEATVVEEWPR